MTIGVVAKFLIKDGKSAEFEDFFVKLTDQVRADEPGNLLYQLVKSRTEANSYKVLELYRDEEAITQHRETAHYKAAGATLATLLAARPEIEYLDGVG